MTENMKKVVCSEAAEESGNLQTMLRSLAFIVKGIEKSRNALKEGLHEWICVLKKLLWLQFEECIIGKLQWFYGDQLESYCNSPNKK